MCRPLRIHAPGILHHICARGDNRHRIFLDANDYRAFLEVLAAVLERFKVICVGYCLMANHYHLLLVPQADPIWRTMQQLNSTYCQGFNRRHGRVGHVLQGRYGCRLVQDGEYAYAAIRYVARNPVAASCVERPEAWAWNSYRAAIGIDTPPAFLSLAHVWTAFGTADPDVGRARLIAAVNDDQEEDVFPNPLLHGGEPLARRARPGIEPHRTNGDYIYVERFAERPTITAILDAGADPAGRDAALYRAFHRHGYTLADLARVVRRDPSTICRWIKREGARQAETSTALSSEGVDRARNKI